MKNISIQVKTSDSIDSNILSANIYTNDNQLIFKKKNIEFGIFQYTFPSQGMYKLQITIAKDRYIYTIWKNIYITEKESDKIYLYLNISNSIKTYKIMQLTDQNYEGLPIEKGEIKLWLNNM